MGWLVQNCVLQLTGTLFWGIPFCFVKALKKCYSSALTYTFLLFGVVLHIGCLLPLVDVVAF